MSSSKISELLTPFCLISLLLGIGKNPAAQTLPTGQITEKVLCATNHDYSYAVYLPSGYRTDRRWPIIYGFDPGARGVRAVECFREGAERFGYVVVGSNDSHNGPNVPLANIVNTLLADTQDRFSIDDQRVYTTGFSGGARVAFTVANASKGRVSGVIACGAGFPGNFTPTRDLPFVVFGLAGKEDFNLPELRKVGRTLDSLKLTNRIATFAGEHSWPPSSSCTLALEWMELQAMKTGKRDIDATFVGATMASQVAQARAAESAGKIFDAYQAYEALASDFQKLADVSRFTQKANSLRSTREVKDGMRRERDEEDQQVRIVNEFFTLREQLRGEEGPRITAADLQHFIDRLKRKADSTQENSPRVVARRSLSHLYIGLIEEANGLKYDKRYSDAARNLGLAAEIMPENPRIFYGLARAHALAGEKKQAVEALTKAFAKGSIAIGEVTKDPELDSIRGEQGYQRLILEYSQR
jgi:pimeloyl-ACP methyl ester carboxylesterase